MGRNVKPKDWFWQSTRKNAAGYLLYYDRLMEIAITMFKWDGVDETIDTRYIEYCLFANSHGLVFDLQTENPDINGMQFARANLQYPLDIYNNPMTRHPYATNGFDFGTYTNKNSVIIWNNFARTPSMQMVDWYAQRLYEIDVTIDINAKAQRTPVLLLGDEDTITSLNEAYAKVANGEPVIALDKNLLKDGRNFTSVNTSAPFIADRLYQLRTQIWNEALTYLGVTNSDSDKKERQNNDEIHQRNGGTMASRNTRLAAREEGCKLVNKMFNKNWSCTYRDVDTTIPTKTTELEVEQNG